VKGHVDIKMIHGTKVSLHSAVFLHKDKQEVRDENKEGS
jgi:hypothetical protein